MRFGTFVFSISHDPSEDHQVIENTLLEMASIGRPVLIGVQTLDTLRQRLHRYTETMLKAGFEKEAVETP